MPTRGHSISSQIVGTTWVATELSLMLVKTNYWNLTFGCQLICRKASGGFLKHSRR